MAWPRSESRSHCKNGAKSTASAIDASFESITILQRPVNAPPVYFYGVPTSDAKLLTACIKRLQSFQPKSEEEKAEHERRAPAALTRAATLLSRLERDRSSEGHQLAQTILLENRVRSLAGSPDQIQKQLLEQVRTGRTSVLLEPGPEGLIRDPEVHFDGRKIVFSMRKARDEIYSIYELQVDPQQGWAAVPGSLRRLTNEPDATDIDPVYLTDGKIVFSSTREPKYCHCNMHIMANLYRMDGDGANIHQIGKSTLFESHASVMPDGRVLYYRWEYVDRNFGDAQGLWTVNPDGTAHSLYWGNNIASPPAVFDGRAIPGTDRVVCIFGSCHDRPWGAMAVVDRSKGLDSEEAVVRIWPASARALVWNVEAFICDHLVPMRSRYEDPFPLVDPHTGVGGKYFLVSRNVNALPAEKAVRHSPDVNELQMAIFLVDVFGNEVLLHAEPPGCFDPMPLAAHRRPPVVPERRDYHSLLPAGWDPALAGDLVMLRLVKVTAPQAKGAHDAEFVCVGERAYIVEHDNDVAPGHGAGAAMYCVLTVVNLKTLRVEETHLLAKAGQAFANVTLPHAQVCVPRIIRKDQHTLRTYFCSQPPKEQAVTWYRDFDLRTQTFESSIHKAKLMTAAGVFDMEPRHFHADAAAQGFTKPSVNHGLYIFDSFKEFDGRRYVALNNFPRETERARRAAR